MDRLNDIDGLVAGLYPAAMTDDGLRRYLHDIVRPPDTTALHVVLMRADGGQIQGGLVSTGDEADTEYRRDYASEDRRVRRGLGRRRGTVLHQHDVLGSAELTTAPVYNEFLARRDGQSQLFVAHDLPDRDILFLSQARPGQEPYGAEAVERFAVMGRHLCAAIGMRRQIADLSAASALEASAAAVLLDGTGRVTELNDGARAILGQPGAGLGLIGPYLRPGSPRDHAILDRAIADAIAGRVEGSRVFRLGLPPSGLTVTICSLVGQSGALAGASEARLLLLLRPLNRPTAGASTVIAALDLTPAEAEVALGIGRGRSPDEIASDRGVSITTVRWTLRNVYARLGLSGQAQLAALINRL